MQSQIADSTPVSPLGKLDETYASALIRVYSFECRTFPEDISPAGQFPPNPNHKPNSNPNRAG